MATTWTPAQFRAFEVIKAHEMDDPFTCVCDWHEYGGSHASHVVNELTKAGLFGPVQHGTVDQLMRDAGDFDGTPAWTPPRTMTVAEALAVLHPDWTEDQVAAEARQIITEAT